MSLFRKLHDFIEGFITNPHAAYFNAPASAFNPDWSIATIFTNADRAIFDRYFSPIWAESISVASVTRKSHMHLQVLAHYSI